MLCATSNSPGGRSGRGVGMKSQHVVTDANRRGRKGKKRPCDIHTGCFKALGRRNVAVNRVVLGL